jgi:ATP adenylyltransferase
MADTEADCVGVPDELDRLWTPHRMAYIKGDDRDSYDEPAGCPFCLAPDRSEDEGLVVARGETVFAVLNLYPYNAGHLMVVPYRHVPDYTDLTTAEVAELGLFTQTAMRVVRAVTGAHGFNIGMNQGSVAGAGIADHLHQHAVPRWGGDTNFMPVIGLTRVLPQVLSETRALLAAAWAEQPVAVGEN